MEFSDDFFQWFHFIFHYRDYIVFADRMELIYVVEAIHVFINDSVFNTDHIVIDSSLDEAVVFVMFVIREKVKLVFVH